ncbi:hypothetical protein DB88DRAFT_162760 [Papiliotrema laurentii]|uniref:Uncharacterized protein n=1 Tax=Papiliotrema laurentii TaxID=5418 RepID=A0AAD9FUQ7_PAPLA|nr:hypothetical protein DB88DRAFT_162760 [Papiliotrema laurentii]
MYVCKIAVLPGPEMQLAAVSMLSASFFPDGRLLPSRLHRGSPVRQQRIVQPRRDLVRRQSLRTEVLLPPYPPRLAVSSRSRNRTRSSLALESRLKRVAEGDCQVMGLIDTGGAMSGDLEAAMGTTTRGYLSSIRYEIGDILPPLAVNSPQPFRIPLLLPFALLSRPDDGWCHILCPTSGRQGGTRNGRSVTAAGTVCYDLSLDILHQLVPPLCCHTVSVLDQTRALRADCVNLSLVTLIFCYGSFSPLILSFVILLISFPRRSKF